MSQPLNIDSCLYNLFKNLIHSFAKVNVKLVFLQDSLRSLWAILGRVSKFTLVLSSSPGLLVKRP